MAFLVVASDKYLTSQTLARPLVHPFRTAKLPEDAPLGRVSQFLRLQLVRYLAWSEREDGAYFGRLCQLFPCTSCRAEPGAYAVTVVAPRLYHVSKTCFNKRPASFDR